MTSSSCLEAGHSTTPNDPSEATFSGTILLQVNGKAREVRAALDTPLLHVLRNDLELNGPKFGCGLGECAACTIILDGWPARSCVIPINGCMGRNILTLEGLARAINRIRSNALSSRKKLRNAAIASTG